MELRRRVRVRAYFVLATAVTILTAVFDVSGQIPTAHAAPSVPYLINFQGRLTDNSGNVLSDGSYNIKFRIWDNLTAGTNRWEGDRIQTASDNRITVTSGLFNIQFGDTAKGDPALSPTLFNSQTYANLYLEVELPTPATATCATNGCAVFTEGAMTPRQPLASSPYAFNSDTLDGLDATAFAQLATTNSFSDVNTFSKSGGAGVVLSGTPASGGSLLQIGSALSSGSTNGTLIGANTSLTGDLLNLQVSGASKLKVDNSGNLTLASGTVITIGATAGTGNACTGGQVLQNQTTVGGITTGGSCAVVAGTGANTALSNLTTTSINQDLLPSANNTRALGSAALVWSGVFTRALNFDGTAAGTIGFPTATAAGNTLTVTGQAAGGTAQGGGAITVRGGIGTTTGTGGLLTLAGGNAAATGINGSVSIDTGSGGSTLGAIDIGNSTTSKTINLGAAGSTAGTTTVNIGTTSANNQQTIAIGSTANTGSLTNIFGGATGGIGIQTAAAGTLSLQTTNNAAIATGTGLLSQGGNITFTGTAGRTITGPTTGGLTINDTGGNLTLSTTTSGTLAVSSAGALNLGGAAASTLNVGANTLAVTSSNFSVTTAGAITAATATNTINNLVVNNGALSGVTGYTQNSGTVAQSFTTAAAGTAHSLTVANTNTTAGIAVTGLGFTPTNTATATSGTNLLNVVNFAAGGTLGGTDQTNGINFASATGYTNFINSPSAILNSSGAWSGVTGLALSSGNISTPGNISTTGTGAITSAAAFVGPTATNTINGLVINAGALSSVTGITTNGGYTQSGTNTNTFTGLVSVTSTSYVTNQVTLTNGLSSATPTIPNTYTPTLLVRVSQTSGSRPLFFGYDDGTGTGFAANMNAGACGAFTQMCLNFGNGATDTTAMYNTGTTLGIGGGPDGNFTDVVFNNTGTVSVAATAAPTADQVSISNAGFPVSTAGANGLNITYVGGTGAMESSGAQVDTTPGSTSGSTWNGLRITSSAGAASGVAFNGIKLDGPASAGAGTETGLNITTGWDVGVNIASGGLQMTAMADPPDPASGNLRVYANAVSGRTMLKGLSSTGVDFVYQPSLFQQNVFLVTPGSVTPASATAILTTLGAPITQSGGTFTGAMVGSESSGYMVNWATTNTTNTPVGFMQSASQYYRGSVANGANGFFVFTRMSFPDTITGYQGNTGTRFFAGLTSQSTGIGNMTNADTPTGDYAGFRISGSLNETAFQFITRNNATTTVTPTTVAMAQNKEYDLYFYVKPYSATTPTQNQTIYWRIDNLTDGTAPVENSVTATLPTAATAMRYVFAMQNLNATSRNIRFQRAYVETDR